MGSTDDKVIVVYSGGMDSTVALAVACEVYGPENVTALNFYYGSKHNRAEQQAAVEVCRELGINFCAMELDFMGRYFKSDLLQSGGEIPEGHYEHESMKATIVPFRNGIMLSIAAGYAESIGACSVWLGSHAGDHAIYPDCRSDFNAAMCGAAYLGTGGKVKLHFPFQDMTKAEIIRKGVNHHAPLSMTYSCYKGELGIHCGVCGTCTERIEAFRDAGYIDRVRYAIEINWATPTPSNFTGKRELYPH